MDMEYCSYMVTESQEQPVLSSVCPSNNSSNASTNTTSSNDNGTTMRTSEMDKHVRYKEALAANLLYGHTSPGKQSASSKKSLLHFHSTIEEPSQSSPSPSSSVESSHASLRQLGRMHSPVVIPSTRRRHIPSSPTRILDAPELRDDYYLNLVSWGDNNVLAVALDQIVYLYNTESGAIQEVKACGTRNDYVTSVAWVNEPGGGARLAIGTFNAELQVWDTLTTTKVRTLRGHHERIGALAWNGSTLASGSRDTKIIHHDLRGDQHIVSKLVGHQQEICGLAWSPDAKTLASGGNDNCMCLWDSSKSGGSSGSSSLSSSGHTMPRQKLLQHKAAVKALAWCPWERHLLASGGGTADRTIKFWHSASGKLLNSVNTGSQVCGLVWSKTERELLSSHGFSQNELCLWKYPTMTRVREFTGHTARVLHLAMSPDGSSVVSAAADETLRFWNVFSSAKHATQSHLCEKFLPSAVIR